MSPLEAFGLIAGVASVAAIPLAVYYARRHGHRQKLLAYHADVSPVPLVSTRSLRDYKLSVVFQPEGGPEERIAGAYVHFLRFANFGREPIRRDDIAPGNLLRVEINGTRVLDIALEAVRRGVCNIAVDPDIQFDDKATAPIDFDFLDYHDGALVRILTTSRPKRIALVGDVIGMPAGIRRAGDLGRRTIWTWLGMALALALEASALALTPFVFRWVTGSWADAWLLALPLVALIAPIVVSAIVAITVWPKGVEFPRELLPHIRGIPPHIYYDRMYLEGPGSIERYEVVEDMESPERASESQRESGPASHSRQRAPD